MSDALNILHIIPYFNPAWAYGGSVRVASELCAELVKRGHAASAYTTDTLNGQERLPAGPVQIEGVSVHRFRNLSNTLAWNRLFMPLEFGFGLARKLRQFDIIHIHEYRSLQNVFALPALRRTGTPYILTPHGGLPAALGRTGIKQVYDRLVGQRLLAGAARLHALTEMERQQYLAWGLPESKTAIIPNGLDLTSFDHAGNAGDFKRRYHIPEGRPVVGYLGRLSHIKGVDFLIDAFAGLLKHKPEALLMLVGPDDGEQAALEAQVTRLGIGEAVRFTGFIGDIETKIAAYRAFDVYALPSRYENQPTTMLEALFMGVPGIVTERCGLAEELSGESLARVVSFGDVRALTEALFDTLENPASRQIQRGRDYVIEHFNWQTIVDQWITLYRDCLD